ncbi:hypothetical protein BVI1335_1400007 [Burkholderia vietnamiensis]|nr:hypothetical protein BVI1335_1400007 [Burkholderia vietnamiensis]
MRGVVSLAAAIALPADFPARDLILFSTFLLIIATLVVQGGTLAPLIRVLKLRPTVRHTMSEHAVRAHTFGAALAALAALDARGPDGDGLERASRERLLTEYRNRVAFNERAHRDGAQPAQVRARMLGVELEMVGVSRDALLALHRDGRVDDAVLHRIESELDFEELRLQRLLEP